MKFYWLPLRSNLSTQRPHSSLRQQMCCSLSLSAINKREKRHTKTAPQWKNIYKIIQVQTHNCCSLQFLCEDTSYFYGGYKTEGEACSCYFLMMEIEGSVCPFMWSWSLSGGTEQRWVSCRETQIREMEIEQFIYILKMKKHLKCEN